MDSPYGIALDPEGNLLVVEFSGNRVRRIDAQTSITTTIAGDGSRVSSGDEGPATKAGLHGPKGIALDVQGNIYISEAYAVRRVDAGTGIITTAAGTGIFGFEGDGGPATLARLAHPLAIELDAAQNIYVADFYNHRIRRVDNRTGIITTIAGSGPSAGEPGQFCGDEGPATEACLNSPSDIALDLQGNLFVVDSMNNRVRRIDGTTGRSSIAT